MLHTSRAGFVISIFAFALCLAPSLVSAAQINISIGASSFSPSNVTVQPGDTVVWTNNSSMPHTVTARNGAFNSGTIQPGGTFSRTFASSGAFTYDCQFHPGMTATVSVAAAAQTSSNTTNTGSTSFTPATTGGVTAAQLQAQIQAMLAEVAKLQAEISGQVGAGTEHHTSTAMSSGGACPLVGRVLKRGSSGDDVSRLQAFLAGDLSVYPEAQVTGYYGALTEAAVQRWQTKNNIVSSGDAESTGFGVVGPRTAAAISLQCGGGSVPTVFIPRTTTPTPAGPVVGGFIQVTPVTGIAPLTVQVVANVNTVNSCAAATYTLDWGDGTIPASIAVPAGNCTQLQQVYTHVYVTPSTYIIKLSSGQHSTIATVQVGQAQ